MSQSAQPAQRAVEHPVGDALMQETCQRWRERVADEAQCGKYVTLRCECGLKNL